MTIEEAKDLAVVISNSLNGESNVPDIVEELGCVFPDFVWKKTDRYVIDVEEAESPLVTR
jgi:hypothetical protein